MSATLELPPRIGREFVGMARVFRNEVRAVDQQFNDVVQAVMAPLHGRLKRHPKLRHEQIVQAERVYRGRVPEKFRIGDIVVDRDRARFAIVEVRLTATKLHDDHWDDDGHEPGVAMADFYLRLIDGRLRAWCEPSAICSLHSLARWHERTGHRDHGLLVRDLSLLAGVDTAGDAGEVPTPDGAWVGTMVKMRGPKRTTRALNVRTWR
jgi:hypothetical protein